MGTMIFGYSIGVLNPSYKNVSNALNWGSEETLYLSIFQACLPIGCIIGSMTASQIWNKFGRRSVAFCISAITLAASILCCIPYNASFGMGRVLSGVASGMGLSLAPVFIMEISPASIRAKIGTLIQLNITFGLMLSYFLGVPLPIGSTTSVMQYWWQFMYFFPVFMAGYMYVSFKFVFTHDTPTYYSAIGEDEKAKLATEFIFGYHTDSLIMSKNNQAERALPKLSELMCSRVYRNMLRVAIFLPVLEQLSGINAINFYSTKILYDVSGDIFMSRILTSGLGLVKFSTTFLFFILIRKYGRRVLLIGSMIMMGTFCALFGLLTSIANYSIYPSTIALFLYIVVYTCAYGSLLWIYIGESVDQQLVSIGVAIKFLLMLTVTFSFPFATEVFGIPVVFYFFAVSMAAGSIYGKFDLIETKGKSREEIYELYTKK